MKSVWSHNTCDNRGMTIVFGFVGAVVGVWLTQWFVRIIKGDE